MNRAGGERGCRSCSDGRSYRLWAMNYVLSKAIHGTSKCLLKLQIVSVTLLQNADVVLVLRIRFKYLQPQY